MLLKFKSIFCCILFGLSLSAAHGEVAGVSYTVVDVPARGLPDKTLTVAIWTPALMSGDRKPLLLLSHGYGGSGTGLKYLAEYLSSRGWIVAAPDHHDSVSLVRIREGMLPGVKRLDLLREVSRIVRSSPEDRDRYRYRPEELASVKKYMLEESDLRDHIDRDKIAVGGHSMGGFTALAFCISPGSFYDPEIKAVLLFSSGAGSYLFRDSELKSVKIPSMIFYGEKEGEQRRGSHTVKALAIRLYTLLPSPRFLLELKGGSHFSFSAKPSAAGSASRFSGTPLQFEAVSACCGAFLEKYVLGKNVIPLWRDHKGVSVIREEPGI